MRRLLLGVLTGMLVLAGTLPASAAPPMREPFREELAGATSPVRFQCGDVVITERSGAYVGWMSINELGNGKVRAHFQARAVDVGATDQYGNRYRIVGSGGGTALFSTMEEAMADEAEPLKGHFAIRLNILHEDGGRFGRVHLRGHMHPVRGFVMTERGDCVEL
ncbi:hypothetical protein [Egicoccus sp. AB-alg6-2]|uniref:hypothetical protein n=1 Tax=Egicoccus sp. AB-alg6-2 TaxID=3242692 RepID=UPI00359D8D63